MKERRTCIIIIAFIFLLSASGVYSLKCHSCINCKSTNVKTVTCVLPNITTTTTSPSNQSSSSSSSSTLTSTQSSSSSSTTTLSTTSSSTTTPSTTTTTQASSPEALLYPAENKIRGERSIELKDYFTNVQESDCSCNNGVCDCFQRAVDLTHLKFVCITDKRTENGVTITDKGCGVDLNNATTSCLVSGYSAQCTICSKDLCNFATSLTVSAFILLPALFITFFK